MSIITEQFDELFPRWSLLDKAAKEAQLEDMLGRAQSAYLLLMQSYGRKGYLTRDEFNQVEQIRQFGQYLQSQKMQVNQNLWNEMMTQIGKMVVRR